MCMDEEFGKKNPNILFFINELGLQDFLYYDDPSFFFLSSSSSSELLVVLSV